MVGTGRTLRCCGTLVKNTGLWLATLLDPSISQEYVIDCLSAGAENGAPVAESAEV